MKRSTSTLSRCWSTARDDAYANICSLKSRASTDKGSCAKENDEQAAVQASSKGGLAKADSDILSVACASDDSWTTSPWGMSSKDLNISIDSESPPRSQKSHFKGPNALSRIRGGKKQTTHAKSGDDATRKSHFKRRPRVRSSPIDKNLEDSDDMIPTGTEDVLMACDSFVDYQHKVRVRKSSGDRKLNAGLLRSFVARRRFRPSDGQE